MAAHSPHAEYIANISSQDPSHNIQLLRPSTAAPRGRVFYTGLEISGLITPAIVIDRAKADAAANRESVCIIEDVTAEWIVSLEEAWHIEHQFFVNHASNPRGASLWDAVTETESKLTRFERLETERPVAHIEGIVPHVKQDARMRTRRRCQRDGKYGPHANTIMSYYRVTGKLGKTMVTNYECFLG